MQLVVRIGSEAALTWQGDGGVLVKVRLATGVQARMWADDSCGKPPANGYVIAASGTYAVSLGEMDGLGKAKVCLASTDGGLRMFLDTPPIQH